MSSEKVHGYVDESLWDRLTELGHRPYKNPGPDSTGLRQAKGITEHNMFLYNKKQKDQKFFITVRQNAKINLKELATQLGCKEVRMCSSRVEDLKCEVGCITLSSLFYDKDAKIQWVLDEELLKIDGPWRFCGGGCLDPLDHKNHNVVDMPFSKITELIPEHAKNAITLPFPETVEE